MPTAARAAPDHAARRWVVRAGAFVFALVAGLGAAATASPGAWWAPVTATGCAAAAGSSHAGLVVDFGSVDDGAGKPRQVVQATCVTWSGSDEYGTDVLDAAGYSLSFNKVGLLCSIDGYPATGCGSPSSGGGYEYWSYWHGGTTWTYAQTGPAYTLVHSGGVEGWRFVSGTDTAGESPPRAPAAGPCAAAAQTTTTTTVRSTTTTAGGPVPRVPASGGASAGVVTGARRSSTTAARRGATAAATSSVTAGTVDSADAGAGRAEVAGGTHELASTSHHAPGGGSPAGAIVVGVLIVVLGGGAFVIARVRSGP